MNLSAMNNSVLLGQHDSFNQQMQLGLPQEKSQSVQRRRTRTLNKMEESEQMAKYEESRKLDMQEALKRKLDDRRRRENSEKRRRLE